MNKLSEKSKCLASLAVFRVLYDSEKDIYGIISEFLKEIISSNGKHQFSLSEIAQLLNDTYDFKIPDAVVYASLGRFKDSFIKSDGLYTITDTSQFPDAGKLTGTYATINNTNELIIQKLFEFIEEEKKVKLSEEEKEKIVRSFCSFIIDESTTREYSKYISAFIVKLKQDSVFTSQLNTIKEGVVLYTGLKYNNDLNDLGSWNTELTIYVDTEILFHFAGFNGQLYQTLFNDFFSLVKEINFKSQKKIGRKLIRLKYFIEVKDEIEGFFKKAEYIVSGKDKANPSKTAMTTIIDGCKTPSDVIEKKTRFFELLKTNLILEDDVKYYYSKSNHKFNIEDKELFKKLSEKTGIEDVSTYIKHLNFINIHRKGISNKGFENVGCVLLSGNFNMLQLAWDESLKPHSDVPLASHLGFLTNKFWFKLNKGFGEGEYPKTFDILTKAQIVLSAQLNDSVADKFDELQIKYKDGKLTEEQAVASIAELRRQAKKPEEINEYDVGNVLKSIEESSIEHYIQEQDMLKSKIKKQEDENVNLKVALDKKQQEIEQREKEHQKSIEQMEKEKKEKEDKLEEFREIERISTEKKAKRNKLSKRILITLLFILIGVVIYDYSFKVIGIFIATVGPILTILIFFGINYEKIKNCITKRNSP